MKRWLQFVAALIVGGVYSCLKDGNCIAQFFHVFHAVIFTRHKDHLLAEMRVNHCKTKCPVYFKPLGTCGSPLKRGDDKRGCYCHMETKAELEDNCWAYDRDQGEGQNYFGWPQELNSYPWPKIKPKK